MKKYRDYFNQHVKGYDMKDHGIRLKFHHTYRVMEYAKEIGRSIKLNEKDQLMCQVIGLYHDLGRFEQWTKYNTFWDKDSIDHASLSVDILKESNILDDFTFEEKGTIYTAIECHNKYSIDNLENEDEILHSKIIRDADKLDILMELGNEIKENEKTLKKELLDSLYKKELCKNEYIKTDVDYVLREIGFIFELNFIYSYKFLLENNWIENKFNLLRVYVEDIEEVNKLEKFVNEYVEEKILC